MLTGDQCVLNYSVNLDECWLSLLKDEDFYVSSSPVICNECEKSLRNALGFKTTMSNSLNSPDEMKQYFERTQDISLDSKKLCESEQVCQFCMKNCTSPTYLPEVRLNMFLSKMLDRLSIETKIISDDNPVACENCTDTIRNILGFTTTCLAVEEKIRRYIEVEGTNNDDQIDLNDVQIFSDKDTYKPNCEAAVGTDALGNVNEPYDGNKTETVVKMEDDFTVNPSDYTEGNNWESTIHNVKVENDLNVNLKDFTYENNLGPSEDFERKDGEINIKNEEIEIKSENAAGSLIERKTVKGVRVQACKVCGFSSKYGHCVRRHILSHKSKFEVDLFHCKQCDFNTKYKTGLTRHMITHKANDEVKVYRCDKCPFKTKHKYGTIKHALTHKSPSEIPMFKCEICHHQSKRKEQLKKHMLTHEKSTLPKYKCDRCNYETIHKYNVSTHMLTHMDSSQVPTFKCLLCPYETKIKGSLRSHVTVHREKNRPWHECSLCTYRSKYAGHVSKHLKKKHKKGKSD